VLVWSSEDVALMIAVNARAAERQRCLSPKKEARLGTSRDGAESSVIM
jgi:hypothetical protein